jgi:hypothetical protein
VRLSTGRRKEINDITNTRSRRWLVFLSMPIVAISVMNIITTLASFLKLDRVVISLFILAIKGQVKKDTDITGKESQISRAAEYRPT